MAGRLILRNPDSRLFGCGIRGGEDYYRELLRNKDKYIGKQSTTRYQELTNEGIPRFPVSIAIRDYE
jgi:DNA ligase-1